jgi:undecaprenyl pyrophosphate phosphatase UppP
MLPSIIGSILVSFFSSFRSAIDWSSVFAYIIGFVVSVLAGYLAIQLLRRAVKKRKLRNYAYYVWAIGSITIILSFIL